MSTVAFQKHANDLYTILMNFKLQTPRDNVAETALFFFPNPDVD